MDTQIWLFIVGGLFALVNIFMGIIMAHNNEKVRDLRNDLEKLRDTTQKKEDFKEFKQELFDVLSELKDEIRQYRRVANGQG